MPRDAAAKQRVRSDSRCPRRTRSGTWRSRSRLLRDIAGGYCQNSFLIRQDLLLPLLDPCLILKDRVEFCLICEDLNLIVHDPLLIGQQHLLVLENFLYSH